MNINTYTFKSINKCNMCGSAINETKILGKRLNKRQGLKPNKKTGITTTVLHCKKCGLNFSNPMPIPMSIQDHYGIPSESYWDDDYFLQPQQVMVNKEEWERLIGKIHPGFTSLDIGAGIGKHMITMRALGIDAYGIEPSQTFYNKALEYTGFPQNRLFHKSLEDADFKDDFFDYINFDVVLEHLYNPSDALFKATKWLKPGGRIQIEVPNSKWLIAKILNLSYKIRGMDYITNLSPMHQPFHLFEFTHKSFEMNSRINNYSIKSYRYIVCKTFLPKIFDPILKPIMKWTNTGMQLSIWLEKPNEYNDV